MRDPELALKVVSNSLRDWSPRKLFSATEPHKLTGFFHVHGLLDFGVSPPLAVYLWTRLFEDHGRSDMKIIRSTVDVTTYCTKYVTKELTAYRMEGKVNLWKR